MAAFLPSDIVREKGSMSGRGDQTSPSPPSRPPPSLSLIRTVWTVMDLM